MAYHPNHIPRVLVKVAMTGGTITYTELGEALGRDGFAPGLGLGADLDKCQHWLNDNGLPPLTSLVVSKETGRPSENGDFFGVRFGDMPDEKLTELQNQCYQYEWKDQQLKALGVQRETPGS